MSWNDKINNVAFSITTGDGKKYFPLWKSGEKSKDFNTSIYDFIDVPKSLVERKQPKSSKFPLTFWFDGDNNVDISEEFEVSSNDNRYWIIEHPFYGTIKGHPLSISRNDINFNITEITVDFLESIVIDFPKSNLSIQDNTLVKKDNVLELAATNYASKKVQEPADIQKLKESNSLISDSFDKIQNNETFAKYQAALSQANKYADKLLTDSYKAISFAQDLLDTPTTFEVPVMVKLNACVSAFKTLLKTAVTKADKLFFESQASTSIASYCNASVNYQFGSDYAVVSDIENAVLNLQMIYNLYVENLEQNNNSIYDVSNSYQPNAELQLQLNDLVIYTISNLYGLVFQAKKERIIYLDKATNIILLTHKYYGLASDENIEDFRKTNDIKLNELFELKKGRKIKYYV